MAGELKGKNVNIYIDDAPARDAYERLTKKADDYNKKIDEGVKKADTLSKSIQKYADSGKSTDKLQERLDKVNASIDKNRTALEKVTNQQKALQQQMDSKTGPSLKSQQSLVTKLENEYKVLGQNTEEATKKLEELGEASKVLNQMKDRLNAVKKAQESSGSSNFLSSFFGNLAANAVTKGIDLLENAVGSLVGNNARLSDSLSDIEKATGLSAAGVSRLNKELEKIDTRTSNEQLREIAIGLGQVGEAANSANVEAIDKIVVALGDEFGGGPNEITNTLSVLRNNLQDIKTGDYASDVMSIGNALNELGANGLATAPVVTDIANRIGGVAGTFKITSGEILGTAATFQELGISAERGSTAYITILQKMAQEPAKFAQVAGIPIKEFTNLVNTDMQAAFVAVATGAQRAGKDNVTFSKILKELDADGSGAGEVLSKLGANADMLAKKTDLASGALKSNSSILEEFNKKNNNAAAELEKLQKNFASLFTSSNIQEAIGAVARTLNSFVNVLKDIPEFVKENRFALLTLVAGIVTLNSAYIASALASAKSTAATILDTTVKRARATINAVIVAAELAYGAAVEFVTGRITLAAAAQRIWNAVMALGAGPIGAILVVVGALVVAMSSLIGNTQKLSAEQRVQADLAKRVADSTADTEEKMRQLTKVAGDNNVSLENRKKALNELISISPEYLKGLTLENLKTQEGKEILDKYISSLHKKAEIEAKTALLSDKLKERNQANLDFDKAEQNLPTTIAGQIGGGLLDIVGVGVYSKYDDAKKKVDDLNKEIKILQADVDKAARENVTNVVTGTATGTSGSSTGITFEEDRKKAEKESDKIKKDQEELANYLKQKAFELGQFDQTELEKELNRAYQTYQEKQQLAHGNSKELKRLEELYWQEVSQIQVKYGRKEMEELQKRQEERKKKLEEISNTAIAGAQRQLSSISAALKQSGANGDQRKLDALQLNLLRASGKEKLNAQLELLNEEERQALAQKGLTEEKKLLIEEQYRQKRKEAQVTYYTDLVNEISGYLSQAFSIFDQFDQARTAKENAELAALQRKTEREKSAHKRLLENKLISQQEYNRRVAKDDEALDKKKQQIEIKQFERNKKLSIAQALVNGAMAVTKILAEYPKFDFGVSTAIGIAAAIATTAAQVVTISKQKAPEFGDGGYLTGPSHKAGGMPVINPVTGRKEAEVEGGEVILSKKTVRNNAPIVQELLHNSMYRNGAPINPWFKTRTYKSIDYSGLTRSAQRVRYFENGGTFQAGSTTESSNQAQQPVIVPAMTEQQEQLMQAILQRLQQPPKAYVVYSEIQAAGDKLDQIKSDATFK